MKHTKGPWKVKHSESKDAYNVIGTHIGLRYKIARCPYSASEEMDDWYNEREKTEAEANAQLIAAAPDILHVLQALQPHAEKYLSGKVHDPAVAMWADEHTEQLFTNLLNVLKTATV